MQDRASRSRSPRRDHRPLCACDVERATPALFPPRGFMQFIARPDPDTSIWCSTIPHPDVAVVFRQRIPGSEPLPDNVTRAIASWTETSVFFVRSRSVPFYDIEETADRIIFCIPTVSQAHAHAIASCFFFGPHPRAMALFVARLDGAYLRVNMEQPRHAQLASGCILVLPR